MGQIQVGLANAVRLAQGSTIVIKALDHCPLQIDGEPWPHKGSCTVEIKHRNQCQMLSKSENAKHNVMEVVNSVLDWGESTSVITRQQRLTLLKEMLKRVHS